jgi:hypothetical protein
MSESKLVVWREYDSTSDALWDKSILESEGIWATVRNEIMSAVYVAGVMPAQLVVREADLERVSEILEAYSAR